MSPPAIAREYLETSGGTRRIRDFCTQSHCVYLYGDGSFFTKYCCKLLKHEFLVSDIFNHCLPPDFLAGLYDPSSIWLTVGDGIFTAEPLMRVLLALADIALILLLIIPLYKRTKWTTFIEIIIFLVLLLPLVKIFVSFSFNWFNYFLFLFPAGCFLIFFPLSIFLADRKHKETGKA